MNPLRKFLPLCAILLAVSCIRKPVNIEKALVEQVIQEFTEERMAHYLRGGSPKTNGELMETVLSRHSLKLIEFRPAFRRFFPDIHNRVLGA